MPMQGSLSIEGMCRLAGVSRASFYRCFQEPIADDRCCRQGLASQFPLCTLGHERAIIEDSLPCQFADLCH
jgi:hypothetical protein